jgi:hypothetical protein
VSEDRLARIEGGDCRADGAKIAAVTRPMRLAGGRHSTLYCSFCGKSQHEVDKLVAVDVHLQRMHRPLLLDRP